MNHLEEIRSPTKDFSHSFPQVLCKAQGLPTMKKWTASEICRYSLDGSTDN